MSTTCLGNPGVLNSLRVKMSEDVMLQEAIDAVSRGQRQRARDLFTRLLRADQSNTTYWLWMSSLVESAKERRYCLQNVLQLDPANKAAKRGLILMGVIPPQDDLQPAPSVKRKWSVTEVAPTTGTELSGFRLNTNWRTWGMVGVGVLLVGLLLLGFFGSRNRSSARAIHLTITPRPSTPRPTATLLPTNTPWAITPTPAFAGPVPLWMQLEATYTPTPIYVETPHPISEAYRAGLRAFHAGDLNAMLQYMEQAARVEPQAADAHYYIGEARRMLEEFDQALEAYETAIDVNPDFAPAYLGRARVHLAQNPDSDVREDLGLAIQKDAFLAEAYLQRAAYFLSTDAPDAAHEDLNSLEELQPESPLLYLYRAQADLKLEDYPSALANAQRAHELDLTLLPAYLTLGQAQISAGNVRQAIELLDTYLLYEENDAQAWAALGKALYKNGALEKALNALDNAIEIDDELAKAYLYRGYVYLDLAEGQSAVNDFFEARNLTPDSFAASLAMGRALWLAGRVNDAVRQISSSEELAGSDSELAQIYYWRAMIFKEAGNIPAAINNWEALLDLPEGEVTAEWLHFAEDSLLALTPTPTPTASPTHTPTPLPTNTATVTTTTQINTPTTSSTRSSFPQATATRTPRP